MDKESKYREGNEPSHDKRSNTWGDDRYHRHLPKHLARRKPSSSSSSPVREHKRRTGVDELRGEMNNIKPPTFDGEHKKHEDVETWTLGMGKYF